MLLFTLVIHGWVLLMFIGLGFLFRKGKGAFLIAGYNTAPKAARDKIDEKKLCHYMSRLMFALGACWVVLAAGTVLEAVWLFRVGFGLFLAVSLGGVLYINTGGRLRP